MIKALRMNHARIDGYISSRLQYQDAYGKWCEIPDEYHWYVDGYRHSSESKPKHWNSDASIAKEI